MKDQAYFKEMLQHLGPASDEEGWLVRRQIAAVLVTWAARSFLGEALLCDPITGRIAEKELIRIGEALKAEIAGSEFKVVVEAEESSRLSLDLLPHSFVHPLERALQEVKQQKRVQEFLAKPAYSFEEQD